MGYHCDPWWGRQRRRASRRWADFPRRPMVRGALTTLVVAAWLAGSACAAQQEQPSGRALERIVGLPCEGCEAVFEGMPATLESESRIAPATEPGDPLMIEGTVRDSLGKHVEGVIIYAYQTNAEGVYPIDQSLRGSAAHRHGRLRGWAVADQNGRYRFETIRPAGYPGTDLPAHVHMHVVEVGRCTYYIDDIMFEDDVRLTPAKIRALTSGRGGRGITMPTQGETGTWSVVRDIELGKAVPGYLACRREVDS